MLPFLRTQLVRALNLSSALRGLLLVGIVGTLCAVSLTACNDTGWPDRDPITLENIGVDTLKFWPPMEYALTSDSLTVEIQGLKTLYTCSQVLTLDWVVADSGSRLFRSINASALIPGTPECAQTPGLDTLLYTTAPATQSTVYLRTPSGVVTDTLFVFAGTSVPVELLVPKTTDSIHSFPGVTFRDSTAGHPRRVLYLDSLDACEVVQAATFNRLSGGDTLSLNFRHLTASPALPPSTLPACAGRYNDTVLIVEDR